MQSAVAARFPLPLNDFHPIPSMYQYVRPRTTDSACLTSGSILCGYDSPTTNHYIAPNYYTPPTPTGHIHVVAPSVHRTLNATPQRKRPKYTRSKTGCLTCRQKKIKCDESKPNCMRCAHGQRECNWPEGVPTRKKTAPRKQHSYDTRPSTAESSNPSDSSTPSLRDLTPPLNLKHEQQPIDLNLPPLGMRRHSASEPYASIHPAPEPAPVRRQSVASVASIVHPSSHSYHINSNSNSQVMPLIPEPTSSYSTQQQPQRYSPVYSNHLHSHSHIQPIDTTPSLSRLPVNNMNGPRRLDDNYHSNSAWSAPSPAMPPLDPIEPYFHTVQERNLIRHYCDASLSIIMAVPSENPVAAANVPLVFSRPPGSDHATDSLRMALLGVAAVHQSYLLGRSGATDGQATKMLHIASDFRSKSKQLLASACRTAEGTQSDAALGAAIAIALFDIFTGGHNWTMNMNVAKVLVRQRGGASNMLVKTAVSKPGSDDLSRVRLMLDILAVYEMFGCFTTGQEPTLLAPEVSGWWVSETAHSKIEQVFGLSRSLVPLLAQVTCFVSRTINHKARIIEVPETGSASPMGDVARECNFLYHLLEEWSDNSVDRLPLRVHTGNVIYLNCAKILLLRDVLHVPLTDELVQNCADTILTQSMECAKSNMGVDLNWPVIIAGSHMFGEARSRVVQLFEAFRTQCCFEVDTSEHIVRQVWERMDQNRPRADWRSVVQDNNLNVLIL